MSQTFAIVLAAGKGKRMKSDIPKVAHKLHKKTLLQWSIDALLGADVNHIMVVISHHPMLEEILKHNYPSEDIGFCYQDTPLGTAHAVQCGLHGLQKKSCNDDDSILIAYGDTPNVKSATYKRLLQFHNQEHNVITIIAFYAKNPFGYGRVILDSHGEFLAIREEKDCTPAEKQIQLCHSGVMCAKFEFLNSILPQIKNKNEAAEFYLTDVIQMAKNLGYKVGFIASDHEHEFSGVNTPEQLNALEVDTVCAV